MRRRQFIKAAVGASLFGLSKTSKVLGSLIPKNTNSTPPNILVILVDQMRSLNWIPASQYASVIPNISGLMNRSVRFENHFTAATACAAGRSTLATGLYSHQTGVLANGVALLQPGFVTYGTALRGLGFDTSWFGKWHLGNTVADYGFDGGTVPDPLGGPGQGTYVDPQIVSQFKSWVASRAANAANQKPWCTTVSLVNPHDLCYFWKSTDCSPSSEEATPKTRWLTDDYFKKFAGNPCFNFTDINNKPKLQKNGFLDDISYDPRTVNFPETHATAKNCLSNFRDNPEQPFSYWYKMLQLYASLHNVVDTQVGVVLRALAASPYANNTIVIFTSDHGEYAGAHGMVHKGFGVYEESIKVPFSVYDPTGQYAKNVEIARTGLSSSVDLMPLLLTIASGGNTNWQATYPYLSKRLNMAAMLSSSNAPGRSYVLHTTDEALPGMDFSIASHVIGLRTAQGKLGAYTRWDSNLNPILDNTVELELYDYRKGDLSETKNEQATSDLTSLYYNQIFGPGGALQTELRAPLPDSQQSAQAVAYASYLDYVYICQQVVAANIYKAIMALEESGFVGSLARLLGLLGL